VSYAEGTTGDNTSSIINAENTSYDGGEGNDTITRSGTGNNIVYGGDGNDTITGGSGNDALFGQRDNDSISGGAGNDVLFGNDGNDIFVFGANDGNDVVDGGAGGRWIDAIQLGGTGAPGGAASWYIQDSDGTVYTSGATSGTINLGADRSGVIHFSDGHMITYNAVEHVNWS